MPAPRSPVTACPTRVACHVRCSRDPARRAHHDQLLVDTDPDALLELFDLAVTWAELEYPADRMIPPDRWLEFAERHRWRDRERSLRIFGLAADIALRAVRARAFDEPGTDTGPAAAQRCRETDASRRRGSMQPFRPS